MNTERQALLTALGELPDDIFHAYLVALRGVNKMFADVILDDPTPAEKIETAIEKILDKPVTPV